MRKGLIETVSISRGASCVEEVGPALSGHGLLILDQGIKPGPSEAPCSSILAWHKGVASLVPSDGFPGPEMELGAPRGSESHPTFSANSLGKVLSA